jgi:hypothetical protein
MRLFASLAAAAATAILVTAGPALTASFARGAGDVERTPFTISDVRLHPGPSPVDLESISFRIDRSARTVTIRVGGVWFPCRTHRGVATCPTPGVRTAAADSVDVVAAS